MGKPAIIPEWRRAAKVRYGMRSITMSDPRCKECQHAPNAGIDWYKDCPHDPYVTLVPRKEQEPVMEDEMVDGKPTGRKQVTGVREFISYRAIPNTRQIGLGMRSNSGRGVEFARRKGFIFLAEIRSPHFPDGVAETCQFHDCKWQQGLFETKVGTFCRQEEAQLVWFDETGTTFEVGEWSDDARQNRINQLQTAQI